SLSFHKQNKKMEPFLLSITEKALEENTYSHDGEEFLFIMKGTAELVLDEKRIVLEEGDCVYFDSSLKHRLLSKDGTEVKVLAVVTR
ncbi:MAG: cupin domain-containing protein, partial [Geobacteraceae bacterium]|nr:cupin domain-containing protein [Geobacteraceae bacterium]